MSNTISKEEFQDMIIMVEALKACKHYLKVYRDHGGKTSCTATLIEIEEEASDYIDEHLAVLTHTIWKLEGIK